MTTVNVTTNESTVTVSPTSNSVTVTQGEPSVVTIGVLGPAGPSFSSTGKELLDSGVLGRGKIQEKLQEYIPLTVWCISDQQNSDSCLQGIQRNKIALQFLNDVDSNRLIHNDFRHV